MAKRKSAKEHKLHAKTLEIHGGGSLYDTELRIGVDRVTAYPLGSVARGTKLFAGEEDGFVYSRINNRTVDKLERRLASMEGAEACLATSSGMSAITLLSLYLARTRDNRKGGIVSSNRLYGGVFHLFHEILLRLGIDVSFVDDPHDIYNWEYANYWHKIGLDPPRALRFFHLENPSNPLIDVFDVGTIAEVAHKFEVPLVVDSTLATPALLKPLELGADFVVHSLSKYMGDGEVIGGAILGKKDVIDDLKKTWFRDMGPCMSPDNAAIFLSHVESLSVRMTEHCRNAEKVAKFLSRHEKVKQVFYPSVGVRSKRNKSLMTKGFGGLMAFEVKGGVKAATKVIENLKLFWHAPNIGESRSLVLIPWLTTHGLMSDKDKSKAGILPGVIRASLGREDDRDLCEDLGQALAKI
ncbi:MAG: O-acetylhomoserine sulfhydrolase [Candidatus Giovannonibacteria bacterium GW2011_GWA2_44_13b]|uniref:O-acetylhomoserine sulfhydrolase n=1 Tax=Candidatus Giovannonibacteria bacterium GW2011_GWA2_44_13b TaxID=1618647 RepID=A0A0G1GYM7_9BACT|nr:MAG: O-acetylhomoserine sulfhydrolase [Candidatus Giovannonibacteria bacterium GW2011_GWA2_44_13b]